jgi:hypothetical protein
MLNSSIPGRSDKLPISVAPGSYVLPSDTVSALGDGNTMSGDQIIRHVLHHARLGAGLPMGSGPKRIRMRSARTLPMAADGGALRQIPIIAAGGEFVVPPEAVMSIGDGDLARGHDALDHFVKMIRKRNIKTLRNLPGPKVD